MFQGAIQENDIFELTAANNHYTQAMNSNPDFSLYDHSNLWAAHKLAMQILNSAATASPPNGLIHTQPTDPPSASFKPPKLITDNWSGQSYDFYSWLSSVLNGFTLTRCDDPAKLVIMH